LSTFNARISYRIAKDLVIQKIKCKAEEIRFLKKIIQKERRNKFQQKAEIKSAVVLDSAGSVNPALDGEKSIKR
jgi:hypothetical protein